MHWLFVISCAAALLVVGCDDGTGTLTYGGDCNALGQHITELEGGDELDVTGIVESCEQNAMTAVLGGELVRATSIDDVTWSLREEADRVAFDRENDLLPDAWGQGR